MSFANGQDGILSGGLLCQELTLARVLKKDMANSDWYRQENWNREAASNFEIRLSRAHGQRDECLRVHRPPEQELALDNGRYRLTLLRDDIESD